VQSKLLARAHLGADELSRVPGLSNYSEDDIERARQELAQKSFKLFFPEWSENGDVHENYNAITGNGDDITDSDKFYHWEDETGLLRAKLVGQILRLSAN
jgi:hypothetical protein